MLSYNEGIWRFDGEKMHHYSIQNEQGPVNLFSLYKDRSGQLLVGTESDGVYRLNGNRFEKLNWDLD
ncbi:hypothetical protein KFE98_14580 [bacterium SCSIO 12741]|nr:hypothetical protein KFE98_14580 [bacterium SCSIO 12741]